MKADLRLGSGLNKYIEQIQKSGTYGNFGPQVTQLEEEYSALLGSSSSRIVSASNATVALAGAMEVLKSPSWIIPSWTFTATAHAAISSSNNVMFGEVDMDTWILKPNQITKDSGAVVTAPFGSKVFLGPEWNSFDSLVVDAAAAIGAPPEISKALNIPWAVVYSLHATKILGVGEGAIVEFSSTDLASKFRSWTNFGFSGSRISISQGTNGKMSEIHGAIGRYRLSNWPEEKHEWNEARNLVHCAGSELGINPVFSDQGWISPYWIAVFESGELKELVEEKLNSQGFDTRNWWESGCHSMPAFKHVPISSNLDNSTSIATRSLGLPFGTHITPAVVEDVAFLIKEILN
jgi:dTDP-4-amino-4,6-dideoxygalactose transaminase